MTFKALEESAESGSPAELYTFLVYDTPVHFCSGRETVTIDSTVYTAAGPIERSQIEDSDDQPKQNISITVPLDFPILGYFDGSPPSDVILLTIKMYHRTDPDLEVITFWNGRVLNASRQKNNATLTCESVFTSLKRFGLRRKYSRQCPHLLYGEDCRAQDTLFRIAVSVDSIDGLNIHSAILSTYPDARFNGGFIEFQNGPSIKEVRAIKAHVGEIIAITNPIAALAPGASIYVYLGCKHTLTDCDETFSNSDNYGGYLYIPKQNPMGQSSVF
jgi:uncharacterized phage protein (TIGR02218 family)